MSEAIDVITEETEVSTTELACVLGITGRRIRQMAEDGQLQKVSKGRFLLADSVQRYVKFLSDGPMDEEDKKLEKTRRVAETTMKASKATIAKLEAEELKGTMHRAEDVAALTEDLVYTIRGALNALPGRLAGCVHACRGVRGYPQRGQQGHAGAGRVSLRPQEIRGARERTARLVGA